MSNIPRARELLEQLLANPMIMYAERNKIVREALELMHRRKAKFRVSKEIKTLTPRQKKQARHLRNKCGWSVLRIAQTLGTNHGRVSEAVRGKAHT